MKHRGRGEGSVYKRKDGRWTSSISLGTGKRISFYGKTKKEVLEKLKQAQLEQQKGTLVTSSDQTVGQFLTQWLEYRKPAIRIRTYERYEQLVRIHLIPEVGNIQLKKLTAIHLKNLQAKKLKEGLSKTTVHSIHFLLNTAMKDAVKWELVAKNICDVVEPPRRNHYEATTLNIEQVLIFMTTAKGHPLETLWILALTTGMRRGEMLALKWSDIDFDNSMLHVQRIFTRERGNRYIEAEPKTAKSRRSIVLIPMALDLLKQQRIHQEALKEQLGDLWVDRNLVFCTGHGTPLNPNWVWDKFKKLLADAGLPNIRLHDLRHGLATLLLKMKTNPKIVQEILGHSQISMTMDIYSHVLPTMQEEALGKLSDILRALQQ